MAETFVDILIRDGDIVVADAIEQHVSDEQSLEQDIKHMILDSGYLIETIGERDADKRTLAYNKLVRLIEDDIRVIPGNVEITELDNNAVLVTADTIYGDTITVLYES